MTFTRNVEPPKSQAEINPQAPQAQRKPSQMEGVDSLFDYNSDKNPPAPQAQRKPLQILGEVFSFGCDKPSHTPAQSDKNGNSGKDTRKLSQSHSSDGSKALS
jgi:hypothetical protein